jgi:ADP-ribose pyrophosphatase YjhB (NUDIX family)
VPIDASWYIRPPGVRTRTSAGGVVARLGADGRVRVALAREADFPEYVLPKGGVRRGESLEAAACREIAEEAGLTRLTLLDYLGARARLTFDKDRWLTVHYFLFATDQTGGRPTDRHHPHAAVWAALDALPPMLWPEQRRLLEEERARIERTVRAHAAATER